MIRIPWTCPCGAGNTLLLDDGDIGSRWDIDRCQTCREIYQVKFKVEIKATLEGVEKAERT